MKAKRQRVTSRAVMIILGVIAVLLTTGGIAGPQVVYAIEVLRFNEILEETEASSSDSEALNVLTESESLLWSQRSDEARSAPDRLLALSEHPGSSLSTEFKSAAAVSAKEISTALSKPQQSAALARLTEKATSARSAIVADPRSWFDVDAATLVELAAIEAEPVARIDAEGTVTRERVQEARDLLQKNSAAIAAQTVKLDKAIDQNDALATALSEAATQVSAEATRAATETFALLPEPIPAELENEFLFISEPEQAHRDSAEMLRAKTTDLQTAALATKFAVDPAGTVIGFADEAELPPGAVSIPGGDAVRLNYVLTRLEAFAPAFDVFEDARVAYEEYQAAVAAELAAREAARIAEPPVEPPVEPPGEPPVGPPVEPPVDPPTDTADAGSDGAADGTGDSGATDDPAA